jgi:hypothetical protein
LSINTFSMSIHLMTATPNKLLADFKKKIDEQSIVTWSYDGDGDFTHDVDQWRNKAWLRPVIRNDRLLLQILKPTGENISKVVYGIYHGRFLESMLMHCDELFSQGIATALPSDGDKIKN